MCSASSAAEGKARRIWLATPGLATLALGLVSSCGSERGPRPVERVFLITCDTLRADRLGCYGYEHDTSPALDSLARESVVFDRAYSAAPMTLPSVCSMLTGRLPANIGVEHNRNFLHAGVQTIAEALGEHGITTAAVVSNWVLLNPEGMPSEFGVEQGFDHFDGRMTTRELIRKMPERPARDTTDAALAWLDSPAAQTGRLFLWVHYQDPHGPYTPPPRFVEMMRRPKTEEPALPFAEGSKGRGGIPRYQRLGDAQHPEFYRSRYDAEIRYFDHHLGRLLSGLADRGLMRNALVVFSADHGESLGEKDFWFCHGETLAPELVRVPLLVRFPAGRDLPPTDANGLCRSDALVSQLDIWPTVMEAFDLDAGPSQGESLSVFEAEARRPAVQSLGFDSARPSEYAIIDGRYRLHVSDNRIGGLFDLEADPLEVDDIADERPEVVRRLVERLDAAHTRDDGPRFRSQARPLNSEEQEILNGLGYASDKEEDESD